MEEPLRLLSLDGGGVRGLSTIKILKHMMTMMSNARGRQVHPWEVFDMIGGTSTGGLLAVMLGRLRMSVDECEEAYLRLSRNIFTPRRKGHNIFGRASDFLQANGKFNTEELEATIKEIVRSRTNREDTPLHEDSVSPCKVFVCAATASTSTKTVLRSYKPRSLPDFVSEKCTIWEACRATSAATGFFEPIAVGSCGQVFVDGAITYNNPVQLIYDEAQDIFGEARTDNAILVSIGTGRAPLKPFRGNLKKVVEAMKKLVTDSQKAHEDFSNSHRRMVEKGLFVRFNVYPGLEDVDLHEYTQAEKIEAATQDYLHNIETRRVFNKCIDMLLLEPQQLIANHLRSPELQDRIHTPSTLSGSGSRIGYEFPELPTTSLDRIQTIATIPTSSNEQATSALSTQYSDPGRFLDVMNEGKSLMDQQDVRAAKGHFVRILAQLQEGHGEHWQFLRVYRALTIVELTMTFGKMDFDEKKHRLQNAIFYSDKAHLIARHYVTDPGELALTKLQRAVVNGRIAQLEAKQGEIGEVARGWKSTALRSINSSLDELRWSNHEGFEDNQKWAHEWLRSFGCPPPDS